MDGSHPSDLELLEYVEGELSGDEEATVREHLAACSVCAAEVASVERSRALLRAAPTLELPEGRLRQMIDELPPQRTSATERRRFLRSRARLVAVLTPAAAAAIAVVAFVLVTRGGDEQRPEAAPAQTTAAIEAAPAPAMGAEDSTATAPMAAEEAPAEDSGASGTFQQQRELAVRVQGPPREVARLLAQAGIEAQVVDGAVEARATTVRAVERALEGRPDGRVEVYVVP